MITPENILETACDAAKTIRKELGELSRVAVIAGSGWGGITAGGRTEGTIGFEAIPGFETAGVPGHSGKVHLVNTGAGFLVVQEGRSHVYEGFSPLQAGFPVWAYRELGVESIILLGAAGGVNPVYKPGDLVIISDHIYLFGVNPLVGVKTADGSPPFIKGDGVYSSEMQKLLYDCVSGCAVHKHGVYMYVTGPSYETLSEVSVIKKLGGDVVGMSIAPEALIASHLGMKVGAMCCVSNSASEGSGEELSHELVLEVTGRTVGRLRDFLGNLARGESFGVEL